MTLLDNRYQVIQELGEGAFGKTFIAEDTRSPMRRRCVVKQLKLGVNDADNRRYQNLFAREAVVLEQIGQRANGRVPNLLAYFTENGDFYFVMELVPGPTLAERIAEKGKQDEATVRGWLVKSLETLDFLHRVEYADADGKAFRGLIHRDLKPGNIILHARDDAPVLIDFGVVKEIAARSTIGHGGTMTKMAGTPYYMPPEQQNGHPVAASDLYALGVTAMVALTGKSPIEFYEPSDLSFEWRAFAPGVSGELADILDHATRLRARERFQSAREMIETLTPKPAPDAARVVVEDVSIAALLETLNGLLPGQFEQLLLILNAPVQFLAGKNAPPAERVSDLVRWARSANAYARLELLAERYRQPLLIQELPEPFVTPAPAVIVPEPFVTPAPAVVVPKPLPQMFTNSIGMEFVLVPAGRFKMGDHRHNNEKPVHDVTIGNPFYLGKYQVTQGDWKSVMGENPSDFKVDDRLPVERVTWNDCQDFLKNLNAIEKDVVYRLPSEAEWEYACRAGTTGDFYADLNDAGWCRFNSNLRPNLVGQKFRNPFGLHDMHGNVWEWCQDRWHENYNDAPEDGCAWETGNDKRRVMRGGSWGDDASSLASVL